MTFPQNTLNKLSHVAKSSYDASTPVLRRARTEMARTAHLKDWALDNAKPMTNWMGGMAGHRKEEIALKDGESPKHHPFFVLPFICCIRTEE
jgi:hypothetical protein